MICYRASWVVPISAPPIRNGWVAVDRGRVVATGSGDAPGHHGPGAAAEGTPELVVQDLGDVILMPGLVNAHTHLELSHLRNAIAPASHFVGWVRQMMAARRRYQDPRDTAILEGVEDGIAAAVRSGTALVGDISNTLVTFESLAASPLAAVVFYELIGFKVADPLLFVDQASQQLAALRPGERVRASLAAHAPYSVAPSLFRAIRRAVDRDPFRPYSVHLSESTEEVEFIVGAGGPWRTLLEELGAWEPSWVAPGGSPVQYLEDNGFLGPGALVVHGVQMSAADLALLARRGATLVTCPRSNDCTGAGVPPLEQFYASGVRVAVGTDSLASTPDLNVFSELAAMRRLAPSVAASALLDSATRQGAVALGFEGDYGTIEPGKRARLLTISIPAGLDSLRSGADVEQYLVSGIQSDQISWI